MRKQYESVHLTVYLWTSAHFSSSVRWTSSTKSIIVYQYPLCFQRLISRMHTYTSPWMKTSVSQQLQTIFLVNMGTIVCPRVSMAHVPIFHGLLTILCMSLKELNNIRMTLQPVIPLDEFMHFSASFNPTKCVISVPEFSWLGCCVTSRGFTPDPKHLAPFIAMPSPTNSRELCSFLGGLK